MTYPLNGLGGLFWVQLGFWFVMFMEVLLVFIPIYCFLRLLMWFVSREDSASKY